MLDDSTVAIVAGIFWSLALVTVHALRARRLDYSLSHWNQEKQAAVDELQKIKDINPQTNDSLARLEWANNYLNQHGQWIDRARALVTVGKRSIRPRPEDKDLRQLSTELARVESGVRSALRATSPDLAAIVSATPLQATTIAAGMLTLVGAIWACSYFSVLGLPIFPLVRSYDDLLLIGISAGLAPVSLFSVAAALALCRASFGARVARREDASVSELRSALDSTQRIYYVRYWFSRAVPLLLLFVLTGVLAGGLSMRYVRADSIIRTNSDEISNVALLGGIGKFVVARADSFDTYSVVAIPAETIRCVIRSGNAPADICRDSGKSTTTQIRVAPVTEIVETWQSFVRQVGQCVPDDQVFVSPRDPRGPLMFPAFQDGKADVVDLAYYLQRPRLWGFGQQTLAEAKKDPEAAIQIAASNAVERAGHALERWIREERGPRSIYFIGFASGNGDPSMNQALAIDRAQRVRAAMIPALERKGIRECETLSSDHCFVARIYGYGEMKDSQWAGLQGDASRRTVLVAPCKEDIW